jgi:GH3 auxin-responsive promoter
MQILVRVAALTTSQQWRRWQALTTRPRETQEELLLRIISRNRATRFGRDHGFDRIHTLNDYRRQVGVADYERLRPYVERAKGGEFNVLTADPVVMFALTSGSTGEPKLIPITQAAKQNHRALTRLWYYHAYRSHADLFRAKLLGVVSPAIEGHTPGGIPFGAASGLIYQSSPRWIQNAYVNPPEISEIKDFEARYYVTMRFALESEISFLGTPNPSTILKMVETADRNKSDIIKDIHDGTIAARCPLPTDIRHLLASRLDKNPTRARQLEDCANRAGTLQPKDYWPRLQLIGCWKGGSVGVRLKEFSRWFDDATPVRDLGYMGSEAQMTLPITDAGSAGVLDISANFYEFIPESEMSSANAAPLICTELEESKEYYPILTTPGGLYRYDINDVIRVAGFYNQTPLIDFVRKGRDVTNITGEKLHVNHVMQAMAEAQSSVGIAVLHFRACADVAQSRYEFSVELDGANLPQEGALTRLLAELDTRLGKLNVEYAQKRESRRLRVPVLCMMKPGWFERKIRASLTRGARDTQFKAQLLSPTPEDQSEILRVIELTVKPGALEN